MTTFLQLHSLVAFPAANLNRDDAGRPKTLVFGGAERLRISSQSLKRAFRTSPEFATAVGGQVGVRSSHLALGLVAALLRRGLSQADAIERAELALEHDRLGKVRIGKAETEQLAHLGPDELERLEGLADRLAAGDPLQTRDQLILARRPRAADIALFGRMLADAPAGDIEAAAQVAHAFTTHRAIVEDDYFTAVDDLARPAGVPRGSAFVGLSQFGSGLFYQYLCLDTRLLVENLAGDHALATRAAEGLLRAALTVPPKGRQNAFASRAKALYALLELGSETPRSLAAAFHTPVGETAEETDHLQASVRRLRELRAAFARAYGERLQGEAELGPLPQGPGSLQELLALAHTPFALATA